MKYAIGWQIYICDADEIHLAFVDEDDKAFGELVLSDVEDIKQFCDDLAQCVEKLRMRKVN